MDYRRPVTRQVYIPIQLHSFNISNPDYPYHPIAFVNLLSSLTCKIYFPTGVKKSTVSSIYFSYFKVLEKMKTVYAITLHMHRKSFVHVTAMYSIHYKYDNLPYILITNFTLYNNMLCNTFEINTSPNFNSRKPAELEKQLYFNI